MTLTNSESLQDIALFKEELDSLNMLEKDKKIHYFQNFGALVYLNVILLLLQSLTSAGKNVLY
jgi:hypothetical protein